MKVIVWVCRAEVERQDIEGIQLHLVIMATGVQAMEIGDAVGPK